MKLLKEFNIDLAGLKLGQHRFTYQVADEFFGSFDYSILQRGRLTVDLNLERQETFLTLEYAITGTIALVCDRSSDEFDYPLDINERILVKFGEEAVEMDENLEVIEFGTQQINVAKHIFELITVAVPLKKLHPRFTQEEGDELSLVYTSEASDKTDPVDEEPDPRWKELLKLKNKKN